jgi:hypothetical protein
MEVDGIEWVMYSSTHISLDDSYAPTQTTERKNDGVAL